MFLAELSTGYLFAAKLSTSMVVSLQLNSLHDGFFVAELSTR